jgi:hypothetical protein
MKRWRWRIWKSRVTSIAAVAFLTGIGVIGACDAYAGFTSGCLRIKYSTYCWATAPGQYSLFLGTLCAVSLGAFWLAAVLIYLGLNSDE